MTTTTKSSSDTPALCITGATGSCGTATLRELCSDRYRRNFTLVGGIHHTSERAFDENFLKDFNRVLRHDANDKNSIAFDNVDYLFIIPSNQENRVEQVRNYVDAAKRCGVKFILLLSVLGAEDRTILFARQFRDMELYTEKSSIPCCFLRATFFQENFFMQGDNIRNENALYLPIRNGRCAPLSVIDVGRAAAAILNNPHRHAKKVYDLVGPETLDGHGIARAASRALGRDIRYTDCKPDEAMDMMMKKGLQRWQARGMLELLNLIAEDQLANYNTTSFYEEMTGAKGVTLEEFFRSHVDYFRPSRQTGGGAPGQMEGMTGTQMGGTQTKREETFGLQEVESMRGLLHQMISDRERSIRENRRLIQQDEERLGHLRNLQRRLEEEMRRGREHERRWREGGEGGGGHAGRGGPGMSTYGVDRTYIGYGYEYVPRRFYEEGVAAPVYGRYERNIPRSFAEGDVGRGRYARFDEPTFVRGGRAIYGGGERDFGMARRADEQQRTMYGGGGGDGGGGERPWDRFDRDSGRQRRFFDREWESPDDEQQRRYSRDERYGVDTDRDRDRDRDRGDFMERSEERDMRERKPSFAERFRERILGSSSRKGGRDSFDRDRERDRDRDYNY